MSAISASGLSQRFGRAIALAGVDLAAAPGERVAVLGGNGSGKTTLLRILATVSRPLGGELRLFGIDALQSRQLVRPRIGYLGHQDALYPALTTGENLRFFCDLYGLKPDRAAAVISQCGLVPFAEKRVGELSRGLRQRVALARSLVHEPELWVLDEPDASLDDAGRELVARLAANRTLVMATHDLAFAETVCERSVTLREGRIEAEDRRFRVVQ